MVDMLEKLMDEDFEGWEDEVKELQGEDETEENALDLIPETDEEEEETEEEEIIEEDEEEEISEEDEEDPLNELKNELDQLRKERRGLFKDLKSERRIRQEMGGQINNLNSTINQIVQQRQAAQTAVPTPETLATTGVPVEFDEDGSAVVPTEALKELLKPYEAEIASLRDKVHSTDTQKAQTDQAQALTQEILSEDERYTNAHSVYKRARNWVEKQVVDFQTQHKLDGFMTSGEALDYVFDADMEEEFNERFPHANLEEVVIAHDSPSGRFLRKALNGIANNMTPAEPTEKLRKVAKQSKKFKKVLEKPGGLGAATNKQSAGRSVLDIAENLSSLDALSLSDAQVNALEKALAREERVGGIKF